MVKLQVGGLCDRLRYSLHIPLGNQNHGDASEGVHSFKIWLGLPACSNGFYHPIIGSRNHIKQLVVTQNSFQCHRANWYEDPSLQKWCINQATTLECGLLGALMSIKIIIKSQKCLV